MEIQYMKYELFLNFICIFFEKKNVYYIFFTSQENASKSTHETLHLNRFINDSKYTKV